MSFLPKRLVVRLIPSDRQMPVKNILVTVQLLWRGRPYFGDVVGLSDSSGTAGVTSEKIERDFKKNTELFPMDYKVPLDQCDVAVELSVVGGGEFNTRLRSISSGLVDPDIRNMYKRAKNSDVESARKTVDLRGLTSDEVVVDLPLSRAGR